MKKLQRSSGQCQIIVAQDLMVLVQSFFKVFWKKIGHFIVRSINDGFNKGLLSVTQREGVITCIPKDGKPRNQIKNYRPISLLNCIYKIASGVIALRIKNTLNKLIHADQTGFISGRYIGENTRLVYDVMHFAEEHNIPGLLLLIDFEKAFDSISWSFFIQGFKIFWLWRFFNLLDKII